MDTRVYENRRERLRELMRARGLDALLVSHAANRFYLSAFELHDVQPNESAGRLIITASGNDWLCTDARYSDAARRLWDTERIFIYQGDTASRINALVKDRIRGTIGFEAKIVSLDFFEKLSQGLRLEAADGLVEELRTVKEASEIEAIEAAVALNHSLMAHVPSLLKPGRSEYAVAWDIERFFRENGASGLAFPSIVAAGVNAALPHYEPSETTLADNCPVLVDVGCRCRRYCSDQTRTFWLGDAPAPVFERALEQVRTAQAKALETLKPGIPVAEVYGTAMQYFESRGVAQYFTHGLGHGIGLETHEAPSLNSRSTAVLKQGMVLTVEPGLYYPEWGGVRWEYMVLVTSDGARIL